MIAEIAERGGQVFVVTHSIGMVRAFAVDDLILISDEPRGTPLALRTALSARAKQGYERRLDGPVAQALFSRVPMLVEGPSDRAVMTVFWDKLATDKRVEPRHARMLDFINCEGASLQPEMARLLCEARKHVVAWAELDEPENLARLQSEGHCSAIVRYGADSEQQNLEGAIASACSIKALASGMTVISESRGYDWARQQRDLLDRCEDAADEERAAMRAATNIEELLCTLPVALARQLVYKALTGTAGTPFEIKGARPARQLAERIIEIDGVPGPFMRAMTALDRWIADGCAATTDVEMGP